MTDRTAGQTLQSNLSDFAGADILGLLRRNAGLILLVTLLGSALTAFWLSRQAPIYVSSAAVVLRGSELPSDTTQNTQNQTTLNPTQVFTEVEVMSSRDFVRRLAERLDLFDDPRYNPALAPDDGVDMVAWLQPRLDLLTERVFPGRDFRFPLPVGSDARMMTEEAQHDAVVNKLLSQYDVSASDRHNVVRIQIRHPNPELAAYFANEAANLYIDMRATNQQRDLDRLITFLTQRSNEIADGLKQTQSEAAALIRDHGLHDTTATQLLIAENIRLENMAAVADPGTERTREINTRLAEIDTLLDARVAAEIALAERELALKTETSRFDSVRQRLDELEAQRQTPNFDVDQIARAEIPLRPISPSVGATMAIAVLAFGFIGIVLVILRENIDHRVTSSADAEKATGAEVATSLPKLNRRMLRKKGGPAGVIATHADASYANGVSSLVTLAMRDAQIGKAPVVLIGSSISGEGKSSISSAMAVSASRDDLRVLLIDFDTHHMGASTLLNAVRNRHRMTALLNGEVTASDVIRPTKHAGWM